jgi:hypothetical protein
MMKLELEHFDPSSVSPGCLGVNLKDEVLVPSKALHLTALWRLCIATWSL